jgi:hypothetical protein
MKRKQYSLSFKLKVISYYELNKSLSQAAKEYIVDRKTIRKWIASKESIKKTNVKTRRKKVQRQSTQVEHPEMEAELYRWIKSVRADGGCIDGKAIKRRALRILASGKPFLASNGWLLKFLKRRRLSLRRITTKGRKPPQDMPKIIKRFVEKNEQFHFIDRRLIFNMDETAVYLDFPSKPILCLLCLFRQSFYFFYFFFLKIIIRTKPQALK